MFPTVWRNGQTAPSLAEQACSARAHIATDALAESDDAVEVTAVTAQWTSWHQERLRALTAPHGFLAVTDLHWLTAEPTRLSGTPVPRWRIHGTFRRFTPSRPTTIGAATEGIGKVYEAPGQIEFEVDGKPQRLTPALPKVLRLPRRQSTTKHRSPMSMT